MLRLELARRLDTLPRRRDLDQHALARDTDGFVQLNQLDGLVDRRARIERQASIDLRRHAARDDLEDLFSERHEQAVYGMLHDLLAAMALGLGILDGRCDHPGILLLLHRSEDQRWVRRCILWLVHGNRLKVARVRDDRRELLQRCQSVRHGGHRAVHYVRHGPSTNRPGARLHCITCRLPAKLRAPATPPEAPGYRDERAPRTRPHGAMRIHAGEGWTDCMAQTMSVCAIGPRRRLLPASAPGRRRATERAGVVPVEAHAPHAAA